MIHRNLSERQFHSQLTEVPGGGGGTPPTGGDTGLPSTLPANWYEKLPEDLRGEESLKSISDFGSLVKSYVHAQKMVGAEKIAVPGKHATDDDWKNVYSKLGLPKDTASYNMEVPKDTTMDSEFLGAFKEAAFKNGVLPKQANGLMAFFNESIKATQTKNAEKAQIDQEAGINSLKTEWGAAFNDNLSIARLAVNKLGNPELKDYLEKSGLGNNPVMIKLFSNVGKFLKEEKQLDIGSAQTFDNALSPADAQKKIESLLTDVAGPYYDAEHPKHKAAVQEVQDLYKYAYPS